LPKDLLLMPPRKPMANFRLLLLETKGMQRREELVNTLTHGLGIPLSLLALVLLFQSGWESQNILYLTALLLYGLTMLLTYLSSTFYHLFHRAPAPRRRLLHLLDHSAIYLYIAGTYTPIALFVLPGLWSWGIFGAVWAIALLGVIFKVFFLGRFPKLSLVLYLLMGWLILVAFRPLWQQASADLLLWMLAGGLCYTLGTIFFSWRSLRYHHGIWHLMVLAGSICHFVGIYAFLGP